jgi:two-component system, NtrC family, sensor kinase
MIATSAARLCNAQLSHVFRFDGDLLYFVAQSGLSADGLEAVRNAWPRPPDRGSAAGRAILSGAIEQIPDVQNDPEYALSAVASAAGFRSTTGVPILIDNAPVGVITVSRSPPGPFPENQVELLRTFADQAIIAIENTRLFREVRETLEFQAATSDVLNVISRSPSDIQPVLEAIAETAQRLCESEQVFIMRLRDGLYHLAAAKDASAEHVRYLQQNPLAPGRDSIAGRVAIERRAIQIPDVLADPEYSRGTLQEIGKFRTALGVPLLRDGVAIGVIVLTRNAVRPFSKRQLDLVATFADQAVIAINNAGLFEEVQARTRDLQETLEYQTATSEVLNVISRSPTNAHPVFERIVESASRLCGETFSVVWKYDGDLLHYAVHRGFLIASCKPIRSGQTAR